jgi:hypothetical protein
VKDLCFVKKFEKSTTKLAIYFISAIGFMIGILLVPGIIEEANAVTTATVLSHVGPFSDVEGKLFAGRFNLPLASSGPAIAWQTIGTGSNGNERGVISAKVDGFDINFVFNNPASGRNTCDTAVSPSGPILATCHITQGNFATATFEVSTRGQENNNIYCKILDKFGGEQTKSIKEKLNC